MDTWVPVAVAVCVPVPVAVAPSVPVRDAVAVGEPVSAGDADALLVCDAERAAVRVLLGDCESVPLAEPELEGSTDAVALAEGVSVALPLAVGVPLGWLLDDGEPVAVCEPVAPVDLDAELEALTDGGREAVPVKERLSVPVADGDSVSVSVEVVEREGVRDVPERVWVLVGRSVRDRVSVTRGVDAAEAVELGVRIAVRDAETFRVRLLVLVRVWLEVCDVEGVPVLVAVRDNDAVPV